MRSLIVLVAVAALASCAAPARSDISCSGFTATCVATGDTPVCGNGAPGVGFTVECADARLAYPQPVPHCFVTASAMSHIDDTWPITCPAADGGTD